MPDNLHITSVTDHARRLGALASNFADDRAIATTLGLLYLLTVIT